MPFHWHIYIWQWPSLKVKFKVMHISTANFSQMVIDGANNAIANKYKVAYGLRYWHIYIWPWPILKVKVMHKLTKYLANGDG